MPAERAARPVVFGEVLFDQFPDGTAYRLLGVGLSDLVPATLADRAGDLLDPHAATRAKAERAADDIRARFGEGAILKSGGTP